MGTWARMDRAGHLEAGRNRLWQCHYALTGAQSCLWNKVTPISAHRGPETPWTVRDTHGQMSPPPSDQGPDRTPQGRQAEVLQLCS